MQRKTIQVVLKIEVCCSGEDDLREAVEATIEAIQFSARGRTEKGQLYWAELVNKRTIASRNPK